MNNKTVVNLVISSVIAIFFVSFVYALDEQSCVKFTGTGTFTLQGTLNNVKETTDTLKEIKRNVGIYIYSMRITKELDRSKKISLKFKCGRGLGLENPESLTYVSLSNVDQTTDNNGKNTQLKISEFFYQQSIKDKFIVSFGKLDFTSHFADNEYAKDKNTQFITDIFACDKSVCQIPQRLAIKLSYVLTPKFNISYGYFVTDIEHIDASGVNIFQITYKHADKNGTCKTYIWENNNHDLRENNLKAGKYGFGISIDREVNNVLAIFGRFGYKNSCSTKDTKDSIMPISVSWNSGMQLKGSILSKSRINDTIGIAIGQIYLKSIKNNNMPETAMELYYRICLNKNIAITPAIQYIKNPKCGNFSKNNNIFCYCVRTQFAF
ncbi:MAG: carbohydrate porin [Endomicrobium sp.]|jgi:hypothetical protein|nr:carbohydrate porin [Endomicrobium sp.]